MRVCPQCGTEYAGEVAICATDGSPLVARALAGTSDLGAEHALSTTIPVGAGSSALGSVERDGRSGDRPNQPTPGRVRVRAGSGGGVEGRSPVSAAIVDPLVGTLLQGRYRVTGKIGEGGMGAVYEAQHTLIGKRVAVKVLLERYAQKSEIVARLQQEARLASAIGNEHIVDMTDFGQTEDGRTFVVMEFLEGESFGDLIAREAPLPAERAIAILRQVANALGAAHEKGIVHRDVKPENIFLVRRGDHEFVKVVDFGISKILRPGDEELQRLTQTGMVLGTPLYMSPEQARGDEDLDARIDIYALGVILYESVTGEVPFRGKNSLVIINQVLAAEPKRPRELRPDLGISEALEAVILHAMAKERGRRYQTMAELDADLARLQAGELDVGPMLRDVRPGASTGAFARRASERWLQIAAFTVVAVATTLAIRASLRSTPDPLPPLALGPLAIPDGLRARAPATERPVLVDLVVRTRPAGLTDGAQVFYKGPGDARYRLLGQTPLSDKITRATETGFVEIEKAGFVPVIDLPIDPSHDLELTQSLERTDRPAMVASRRPLGPASAPAHSPEPAGTIDVSNQFRLQPNQ